MRQWMKQSDLQRIIANACYDGLNDHLAKRSKELGITETELCRRIAEELEQRRQEARKAVQLFDPT